MENIKKIDFYFLRLLFIIPWISILVQIIFVNAGFHRFKALSYTNKILAFLYLLYFLIFLLNTNKISKNLILYFFLLYYYSIFCYIFFKNNILSILIDFTLLTLQGIFFYLGTYFSEIISNYRILKIIISDSIILALILGTIYIATSSNIEIVNPSYALFILSSIYLYVIQSIGGAILFILAFIIYNIVFSFGKQNIIITLTALIIYNFFFKRNGKNKSIKKFLKIIIIIIGIVISGLIIYQFGEKINAIKKLSIFLKNFKYELLIDNLSLVYENPYIVYKLTDLSTAGRLSEFFIAIQTLIENKTLILGNGLGIELDFSERDKYTYFYEFEKTRSVQTLLTFILTRFGILGWLLTILIIVILYAKGFLKNVWGKAFLVCFILSLIAFSTVFKYHYMMFFLGVAIAIRKKYRLI